MMRSPGCLSSPTIARAVVMPAALRAIRHSGLRLWRTEKRYAVDLSTRWHRFHCKPQVQRTDLSETIHRFTYKTVCSGSHPPMRPIYDP